MRLYLSQVYIEPGANYPFSAAFQFFVSKRLSALVRTSDLFSKKYGGRWALIFRMSAKKLLQQNEIRGPTVFRKAKDVEYTIFLPFDVIARSADTSKTALVHLLSGVCSVLESLEIDAARIRENEVEIINHVCNDPKMFRK